ncbi:MAG: hypothetical protein ACRCY5_01385, partial [Phocaeicola sp.]
IERFLLMGINLLPMQLKCCVGSLLYVLFFCILDYEVRVPFQGSWVILFRSLFSFDHLLFSFSSFINLSRFDFSYCI